MKRTSLFAILALMASITMGQNQKYMEKMGETIQMFGSCNTPSDFQELANRFHVIASAEPGEWLPLYYEAHCYILMSFMEQSGKELRDAYLDKASGSIEKMLELAPGEAEVYVMKAFYHTGYLVIDPPQRAMSTTPQIQAALSRALQIEPDNPRARFLQISNELGTASFFGSDTAPICEKARKLLETWDAYQLQSPIHPGWGKSETQGIVDSCGQ
jgi:hypothetical protein